MSYISMASLIQDEDRARIDAGIQAREEARKRKIVLRSDGAVKTCEDQQGRRAMTLPNGMIVYGRYAKRTVITGAGASQGQGNITAREVETVGN